MAAVKTRTVTEKGRDHAAGHGGGATARGANEQGDRSKVPGDHSPGVTPEEKEKAPHKAEQAPENIVPQTQDCVKRNQSCRV